MNEMQKELGNSLRKSLHYTFDEESCVSTLDIEKSAANLIASGILSPSPEKFIFHDGCLARKDFVRIVGACKDIGNIVWDAPTSGFTRDGIDYIPVDIMREPEDIEDALRTVLTFLRTLRGGE